MTALSAASTEAAVRRSWAKGRRTIIIAIVFPILFNILGLAVAWQWGIRRAMYRQLGQMAGHLLLSRSLWAGSYWARGLFILHFAAVSFGLGLLAVWMRQGTVAPIFGLFAFVFGRLAYQLLLSKDVKCFFDIQREGGWRGIAPPVEEDEKTRPATVATPAPLPTSGRRPSIPQPACRKCRQIMPTPLPWCPHCGAHVEVA